MDIFRKLMIWVMVIGFGFLGVTLRWWFLSGRRDSLKQEVKENLILLSVIAAIAAVIMGTPRGQAFKAVS
jgi:carbon starvation protein CstA